MDKDAADKIRAKAHAEIRSFGKQLTPFGEILCDVYIKARLDGKTIDEACDVFFAEAKKYIGKPIFKN